MSNYKIEGDLDFYKELYSSLDYDSDNDTKNDTNICQITGSVLKDKFVELECSHKFNYDALYTEICKQKFDFNSYTNDILSKNDFKKVRDSDIDYYIKCPYCRNIQFTILPYYEDLTFIKKYGVNTDDTDYRVVRTSYNPSIPNNLNYTYKMYGYIFSKGKCCKIVTKNDKQIPCYNTYSTEFIPHDGSIKHFCSVHIREEVKQNKIEIQKKKFEEKMKAKEAKLKIKEEKIKIKSILSTKPKLPKKNIVVSTETTILEFNPLLAELCLGCSAIIKTGPRKGSTCGFKIIENNMCKRHNSKSNNNI